jgi:hypothetical protein
MRWAVLSVVVFLVGCSTPNADQSSDGPGQITLRGVVVDQAIRPLPGANVTIVPGNLAAVTDERGEFAFERMAPGSYALTVARAAYLPSTTTVTLVDGAGGLVQVVLDALPSDARFANLYRGEGLYECGAWPTQGCSYVNIATGYLLCETGAPCFNVTADRSVFLEWVAPGMQFLQTELAWTPTLDAGKELWFGVGGANRAELQRGMALLLNSTSGPSPLVLTLDQAVLDEAGIGLERAMLAQVYSGASDTVPGGCVAYDPCGPTVHFNQRFDVFTATFYGYLPPPAWRFTQEGAVPPPPPLSPY